MSESDLNFCKLKLKINHKTNNTLTEQDMRTTAMILSTSGTSKGAEVLKHEVIS